jgi:hypothetical protein
MKVVVVRAHHREIESQSYMVGVFSTYEKAKTAISIEQERMGQSYDFSTAPRTIDSICGEPCEPEVSLEERLEALEQYMNVAQNKIMRLQNAVQSLTFNVRGQLGDERTRSIMEDVMKEFGRHK